MLINYLKNIGYVLGGLLISAIFITLFNYFGILNGNILNIISNIIIILSFFVGGYLTGRKANKKGYLEGIKFGLIMIMIVLFSNLIIFNNEFTLTNILFYLSLLISSTFGSMIGIQRKNN